VKSFKAPFNVPQLIAGVFSPLSIAFLCSFLALTYDPPRGIQIAETPLDIALFGGFIGFVISLNVPLIIHFPTIISFPQKMKEKLAHFLFGYTVTCGLGLTMMLVILLLR